MKLTNKYIGTIEQNIKFLEQIIQKPSISDYARQELYEQINRVKQRCADSNLYLAIVGEFSSGKSTFINALLRDDLLKTSALVATATATRITYADTFRAEALFRKIRPKQFIKKVEDPPIKTNQNNNKTVLISLFLGLPLTIILHASGVPLIGTLLLLAILIVINIVIAKRLKKTSINTKKQVKPNKLVTSNDVLELGISTRNFVQMVTSEEGLARNLDSFNLYHSANFLKDGIVVIDTPGTNAQNEDHGKITQFVVANEADAAVIIIPAGQPVSDTLINFLSGELYQYIHRCVFIITKMDTIRPKEQSRLIKFIKKRLQEKLKTDQLFIIESAPQIVIDTITGEQEVVEKHKHWNENFIELEKKLNKHLINSRDVAIRESVTRLLAQVFRQSESHLKQQQKQFKKEQDTLEKEIIKDLSSFTKEQYSECSAMIKNATYKTKSKVTKSVNSSQEQTKTKLHDLIFSTTSKDELKNTLESKVSPIFSNARSALDRDFKNSTSELNKSFAQTKKFFDSKFANQYKTLRSLSTRVNMNNYQGNKGSIQVSNNVSSVVSELSKTAGDNSNIQIGLGAGAGTGAAIGTILLPGVGTVVGAALGSVLGSVFGSFFGPSLSELQDSSWNELRPKIYDYFDSAEKAVNKSLDSYSQQMIETLNEHIYIYSETYQKIVEAMQQEQRQKKDILNQLQRDIEADLLEINNRMISLEQLTSSVINKD